MIELFDPEKLLPRRDWSLAVAGLALLVTGGALAAYGVSLQTRLQAAERQRADTQQRLQAVKSLPAPSGALLADLQREVTRLEAEAAPDPRTVTVPGPTPAQWMLRLAELSSSEVSLSKIEVDRAGAVRIEGMAASPQAVSRFLQAWDQSQQQATPVPARAIEVRQDPAAAPLLRFRLRAATPVAKARS